METTIVKVNMRRADSDTSFFECKCGELEEISDQINIERRQCKTCLRVGYWNRQKNNVNEMVKDNELSSVMDVHNMAVSSLPPVEFEQLKKCLKMLCETRRLPDEM